MTRKHSVFFCFLSATLTLVAMAFLPFGASATALRAGQGGTVPQKCGKWSIVHSPSPGGTAAFSGVAAISAKSVWAVGSDINNQKNAEQTLIERWNGTSWKVVPSANVGQSNNALTSIAVVSANDMWVVGNSTNGSGFAQTLTEHWNGTNWQVVTSPNVGTTYNYLIGVAAVSTNDVWAVGIYFNGAQQQTLTEHWNGTNWQVVTSPNPGNYDYLYGVTAVSANDVWAVGNFYNSFQNTQTLVEHWNGTSWQVVKSPNPGAGGNYLGAVAAASANDIWAVGSTVGSTQQQTLTEHWNGTNWQVVTSPNVGMISDALNSVAVVSTNNVWAVGGYDNSNSITRTLTEHWNGTNWQVVKSPNAGKGQSNTLNSITHIPGSSSIWSVGLLSFGEGSELTLTAFHC